MGTRFGAGTLGSLACALLATGWSVTQGIAEPTPVAAPMTAAAATTPRLPDGSLPAREVVEAAVSVTAPEELSSGGEHRPALLSQDAAEIVVTASTNSIPSAALAAYQRAEAVINAADETCNISWQLIAAIGRVESDHGRYGGNTLDDDGIAQPGIYGVALDGTGGTRAIPDTDAGQYDNDTTWDRAVGPMQFIPSTWSIVGVDADGDGVRNPQDIDDAALAAAVYLCSGNEDLSETAARYNALLRYNRSTSYAELVLRVTDAYASGDYSPVPNNTISAMTLSPKVVTPQPAKADTTSPKAAGKKDRSKSTAKSQGKPKPKSKQRHLEEVPAAAPPPPAPQPPKPTKPTNPPTSPPPTSPPPAAPPTGGTADGEDSPGPTPGCDTEVPDPGTEEPGAQDLGTADPAAPGTAEDAPGDSAEDECGPLAESDQPPSGGDEGPEQPAAREQP